MNWKMNEKIDQQIVTFSKWDELTLGTNCRFTVTIGQTYLLLVFDSANRGPVSGL